MLDESEISGSSIIPAGAGLESCYPNVPGPVLTGACLQTSSGLPRSPIPLHPSSSGRNRNRLRYDDMKRGPCRTHLRRPPPTPPPPLLFVRHARLIQMMKRLNLNEGGEWMIILLGHAEKKFMGVRPSYHPMSCIPYRSRSLSLALLFVLWSQLLCYTLPNTSNCAWLSTCLRQSSTLEPTYYAKTPSSF